MSADLGVIDILVLCTLLITAIAVGFWQGQRSTDAESYLLGNRSLPWWAILGSIVATETSTATVLSIPGVGYGSTGMKWLQLAFGFVLGRIFVVRVLLPLYFRGKLLTAYQVLDQRFGTATKLTASLLFLVTRNVGDGLRLFLAGMVIHTLLDWPFTASVLLMGLVTIVYTWFGGLRSVVWNDCIQFGIYMLGGAAAVLILNHHINGGWESVRGFAAESGRLQVVDTHFSLSNAFNIWAGLIGGAVLSIGTHGTDHMMVQRYLSARSEREAGRAILLSSLVVLLQFALFLFIGIQLACFYSQSGQGAPEKPDRVFAHFIIHYFPRNTGLIGLMLAAILAAAMSTLSSSLNASASALLNDFWLPRCTSPPSDQTQLKVSRWMTVAFGIVQIAIGISAMSLTDTVVNNALAIAGFSGGLLLGVFLLGVLNTKASQTSALIGMAAGLVALMIVQFVLKDDSGKPMIAWPWLALIGSTVTFAVGTLTSLLLPPASPVRSET